MERKESIQTYLVWQIFVPSMGDNENQPALRGDLGLPIERWDFWRDVLRLSLMGERERRCKCYGEGGGRNAFD